MILQFFILRGCTSSFYITVSLINAPFNTKSSNSFTLVYKSIFTLGNTDAIKEPRSWSVDKFFVCLKKVFSSLLLWYMSIIQLFVNISLIIQMFVNISLIQLFVNYL